MRGLQVLLGIAGCGDDGATVPGTDAGIDAAPPVACAPTMTPAAGWHVSPDGSPGGDGSAGAPWDVATAFAPHPRIQPGDTVWLHGGTYRGAPFVSKLAGTPSAPITVRSYPGEWAVLDGAGATDSIFQVYRSHGVYRDLEIVDSTPHVVGTQRMSGTWFEGTGIKLVNTVIHDTGNLAMYEEAPDLEVYGNLLFHIGWTETATRSHGHNVYLQNGTGTKLVADNAIFNGYSFGIHAYAEGSSQLRDMTFEGNVWFGSGATAPGIDQNKDNFLVGHTAAPASGIVLRENFGWAKPIDERSVAFGYGSDNGALTLSNNYFVGAVNFRDPWSPLTMQGNTFVGPVTGMVQTASHPANTYLSSAPAETRVFVRANRYEPGRAMIVVFNWGGLASVDVDATTLLAPGTPFEVRRVQDYFAAPLVTGMFDGAAIRIPITGGAPAQPAGTPDAIDPREAPGTAFDVFVVRATCALP